MAKRIVTECDVCGTEDETSTTSLTLPEVGAVTLDLCDTHSYELIGPLIKLATASGVRLSPAARPSNAPAVGRVPAKYSMPCVVCERIFGSASGLRSHYDIAHGLAGGNAVVYGSHCPLCPFEGRWYIHHVSQAHGMHGAAALAKARDTGDPYSVVKVIRAKARAAEGNG
jgi:hypothetical protein